MSGLIAFLTLGTNDRIVCVKSWRPRLGDLGIEWPTMLVDTPSYRRNAAPVWNRARFRNVWQRIRAGKRID